jgi:hypothetical protein
VLLDEPDENSSLLRMKCSKPCVNLRRNKRVQSLSEEEERLIFIQLET